MFHSIRCYRDDGLHRVNDAIVSNLLTELPALLQRGRNELDDKAHGSQFITMVIKFKTGLLLGQIVKVTETLFGTTWYGKITGIKHQVTNSKLTTELTILRPANFYVGESSPS